MYAQLGTEILEMKLHEVLLHCITPTSIPPQVFKLERSFECVELFQEHHIIS